MNQAPIISRLTNGMLQGQQVPAALSPHHFRVDERDTTQLLTSIVRLASVLDYHAPSGKPDGTWDTLLLADVSLLAARISQYRGNEKYHEFLDLQNAVDVSNTPAEQKAFLENMFRLGFDAIAQVQAWYTCSNQNFADNEMTTYLRDAIRTQGSSLLESFYTQYQKLSETSGYNNTLRETLLGFDTLWKFNPAPDTSSSFSFAATARTGQLIFNWLDEIAHQAKLIFDRSRQRQDIPPHIGLLLTFLDLFQHEQDAINTITGRHLDFYYKTLLRAQQKEARPDHTLITCLLAKGTEQLLLPAGSLLDGGQDATGQPISFSVPTDTLITETQIADHIALTFPAYGAPGLTASTLTKFDTPGPESWPLFGLPTPGTNVTEDPVTVGFAFSCSDLLMAPSGRNITLVLQVDSTDDTVLNSLPADPIFVLRLTAAKGWFAVPHPTITYQPDHKTFTITFSLGPSDPAVVAYTEKLHGPGFDTTWPVCQMTLTPAGQTLYDALQGFSITGLSITSDISGLSGFQLENDSGKLPNTSFSPFNVPATGSSLYIGGQELAVKQLQQIAVTITWENLPASLKTYYKAYNDYYLLRGHILPVFQNQSFSATAAVLMQGRWTPAIHLSAERPSPLFNLFTDETHESLLEKPIVKNNQKKIVLTNALVNGSPVPLPYRSDAPVINSLNNTVTEGFICLTLTSPTQGFGHVEYPNIVSEVTLANSEIIMRNSKILTFKKEKTKPLPNIPFVPKIKSVTVDYHAAQHYDVASSSDIQWYHLHPFGIRKITPDGYEPSLLPVYPQSAYHYFSFQQLIPDTDLSFGYVLDNQSRSVSTITKPDFTYEYLSAEGWKSLPVVSDTTGGFQCTGVLRVAVPSDAASTTTEMPSPAYWFRMGTRIPTDVQVRCVATQAVTVQQVLSGQSMPAQIAAGTITRFINPMPGIKSITQPVASSGGSVRQTEEIFRQQVATRIHGKNRITNPADIEVTLLSEFPELFRVTAIPVRYAGDAIRVVIVPFQSTAQANPYEPFATTGLLENVLNFLAARSMPGDRYEIENPAICKLQVSCQVVFRDAQHDALLLSQLNTDINNFLSPWIPGQTKSMLFSTSASANVLYAFIRSLGYVEQVSNFQITLSAGVTPDAIDPDVLVVPALLHSITVATSVPVGITGDDDALRVGKNFYITQ